MVAASRGRENEEQELISTKRERAEMYHVISHLAKDLSPQAKTRKQISPERHRQLI